MRIAMIHTPFEAQSGGERQILRLAVELQKFGHVVEVFTNSVNLETYPGLFDKVKLTVVPYPLTREIPKNWVPHILPTKTMRMHKETVPVSLFEKLKRKTRKLLLSQYYVNQLPYMIEMGRKIPEGFDIINNHNIFTNWAGYVAKNRLKVPLVWTCNEPISWFFIANKNKGRFSNINYPIFELFDKMTVKYVDEIIVQSHVNEGYVRKAYGASSKIVRPGVDAELFHNANGEQLRKKLGLENSFVILFVGGTTYAKRSNLIRALAILSKKSGKYSNVKLIIVTYREREFLVKLSEELGVKDKVLLLNSCSDIELAEVYNSCDVFVFPSSASTWGLVVTEAMAASKPVIVSRQVGTSEIITNGVNGIIIDEASPEKIAEQIEILMKNPELCRKLGENAYEYVKNNLSWKNYAKNVENIFNKVLEASN
jgi:glycosyltransferase involved in cell wall biosynthesis